MTVAEQDQTVKSEEVVRGQKDEGTAGDVKENAVDTATTEKTSDAGIQTKDDAVSIEDIMTDAPIKPKTAEEGTDPGVQKRINRAVSGQKLAEHRAKEAEDKVVQLEAERLAPKDKPMVPNRESYETEEAYQEDYDKFLDNRDAYINAKVVIGRQADVDKVRDQENDTRMNSQLEELKVKYPDVKELVDGTDYGYARQTIANDKNSVRIALYLNKNPEERVRIGSIVDAETRGAEIGKLSAQFDVVKSKTTNAPPALDTIQGDKGIVVTDIDKIVDDDDWYKARQAERKRKLTEKYQS